MSGTVTGGVQSTNNIVGNATGSVNVEGYTDQTSVKSQYLAATGLTATVRGRRAVYTIEGQRGSTITLKLSTKQVAGGMLWDYKNSGTSVICYDTWHIFDEAGSFASKLVIYSPLGTDTYTLQLATPVVIGGKSISKHDQSFIHRDETELSEHEESFMGRTY